MSRAHGHSVPRRGLCLCRGSQHHARRACRNAAAMFEAVAEFNGRPGILKGAPRGVDDAPGSRSEQHLPLFPSSHGCECNHRDGCPFCRVFQRNGELLYPVQPVQRLAGRLAERVHRARPGHGGPHRGHEPFPRGNRRPHRGHPGSLHRDPRFSRLGGGDPWALLAGVGCGVVNGFFISRFKLNSFVVTLATSFIFQGLVNGISQGRPYSKIPAQFTVLGKGDILGIPNMVFLMVGRSPGRVFRVPLHGDRPATPGGGRERGGRAAFGDQDRADDHARQRPVWGSAAPLRQSCGSPAWARPSRQPAGTGSSCPLP